MEHKYLGKKLKIRKDYDRVCEVKSFHPSSSARLAGKYEVHIPFATNVFIQEPHMANLFDFIDDEVVKKAEPPKEVIKKPVEDVASKLNKKRAALKLSKKDDLLKIVSELELEDEIAASLKKNLLVEEILKEQFGENYETEG